MASFKAVLNVSAHEFYQMILEVMAEEIRIKTDKTVSIIDLEKGYKYKYKKVTGKKNAEAVVHIRQPQKDKQIVSSYALNGEQYEMIYQISALAEDKIEVEYIQKGGSNDKGLAGFLFQRNMKKRFQQFENYIIQNRNKTEGKAQ